MKFNNFEYLILDTPTIDQIKFFLADYIDFRENFTKILNSVVRSDFFLKLEFPFTKNFIFNF
jgi:hypothetical protein